MQKMNPYFVVAILFGRFGSKNFMRNFERTVHVNMPLTLGTGWLDETAHSAGTPPGPHNAVGPYGIGKFVFANGSSTVLSRRCSLPDLTSPRGTIEVTSHHVHLVLDALQHRLQMTSFSPFRVFRHIGC